MDNRKSLSEQILELSPEQRAKFRIEDGRIRIRKTPEKRLSFTREQLIAFLVKNRIKKIKDLLRLRQPNQDPNFSHYRKEFQTWNDAIQAAYGRDLVHDKPPTDAAYLIRTMVEYNLFTTTKYKAFHKARPDILPSYDCIIQQFRSFKIAVKTARLDSLREMANDYLALKRKLQKTPTLEDCKNAQIDLTKLLRYFKKKGNFDDFIAQIENPLGAIRKES